MALNTSRLDTAVEAFQKICGHDRHSNLDGHWQLYQYGQFYVTNRTVDDLVAQIQTELKANVRFQLDPPQLTNAMNFFNAKLRVSIKTVNLPVILAMLDSMENNGDMAAIKLMFAPTQSDRANAQSDFNTLWSSQDLPANPWWTGSASLQKAQAAFEIEKDRCWQVLRSFARMLLKKRAIKSLPAAAQISAALLGGASIKNITPKRQEIVYASQPELTAAVARMKEAIDNGGYVHCGVLSGALHEHSKFGSPEHHILVFAYDVRDGQDAFAFWDPDAFVSNIASTVTPTNASGWGRGFGILFSRPGRLCTGVDDADLAAIDTDSTSPTFGDHTSEPKRHCYQVYTLQSLPLRAAVKLHTKVMSPPSGASVDDMLDKAIWLYAAHDVEIHEASRETIDPGTDLDRYQTLFIGDGDSGASDEVTALQAALRDRREEFGVEPSAGEAVVAFVDDLVPAARGSAVSPPGQPSIVLSASAAGDWTLAHEIGRLTGLKTAAEPGQLMSASTAGLDDPVLTDEEAQIVLDSPLAEA